MFELKEIKWTVLVIVFVPLHGNVESNVGLTVYIPMQECNITFTMDLNLIYVSMFVVHQYIFDPLCVWPCATEIVIL